jgi:cytochrome c553
LDLRRFFWFRLIKKACFDVEIEMNKRFRPLRGGTIAVAICGAGLASAALAQADDARAKKIVGGVCFLCHGMEGELTSEGFPRLAGQHAEYTALQLENFKSGKRKSSAMAGMVANLTTDDMVALGKYFEKKSLDVEPPKDPGLAAIGQSIYLNGDKDKGLSACVTCHGAEAKGTSSLPRLAGQLAVYIESQLKKFNQRERTHDNAEMHDIARKLSVQDIAAVAEYLSAK